MLVAGLGVPYAPALFREAEDWPRIHAALVGDTPQPRAYAEEAAEVIQVHRQRIERAFAALRERLVQARPDVLYVIASDEGQVFTSVQTPQLCTFLVDEIWGSMGLPGLGEPAADDMVRLKCARELASFVHRELVLREFDLSYSQSFVPLGQPEYGLSPAFVAPVRALFPGLDIPVVAFHLNVHVSPAPSGHRCFQLGQAFAEVLGERDERIALLASGGLSHDHFRDRAGWIDEPLDQWVLDQLRRGKAAALTRMFDLDSDTLRGGAAHVRLWTLVAAACESRQAKAEIIDYIPSYTAATGLGFAYWDVPKGEA